MRLEQPGTLPVRADHQASDSAAGSRSPPFAALDRLGSDESFDFSPTPRRSARIFTKHEYSVLLRRQRHIQTTARRVLDKRTRIIAANEMELFRLRPGLSINGEGMCDDSGSISTCYYLEHQLQARRA